MRIFLAVKYHSDHKNKALIDRICSSLEGNGLEAVCVARDVEKWGQVRLNPQALMHKAFELIEGSDLVLIELSEKGAGLGVEAGYAYSLGIPVLTIARNGSEISPSIEGISTQVHCYRSTAEIGELVPGLVRSLLPANG